MDEKRESTLEEYVDQLPEGHSAKVKYYDLKKEMQAAGNLLALIHGDGGQHIEEVGFIQACKYAEEKFISKQMSIDQYKDYFIHLLHSMYTGLLIKNPTDYFKDCMFVVAMRLAEGDLELAKKIKEIAKDPMEVRKLL